jgi:hypothetical protein
LIGLALLGGSPVLGQTPSAVPSSGTMVFEPGCGCCVPTKTVCVPECYIKKTTHVEYSSGCETRCLCYFHSLNLFGRCGCDSGHCERPIHVRYLIKKTRTCEEQCTKCVPQEVPCCGSGSCCPSGSCCGGSVIPGPGMPTTTSTMMMPGTTTVGTIPVGSRMPH